MFLDLLENKTYKIIVIILISIFCIIFIKVLIEEIIKLGFKGIFIGLPKAILWIIYCPIVYIYKKINEME